MMKALFSIGEQWFGDIDILLMDNNLISMTTDLEMVIVSWVHITTIGK